MSEPAVARPRPCASCPYRRNVASGVWHQEEYEKLPLYDGDMAEQQSVQAFACHHADGHLCAGWLGHRDPSEMLAVRLGVMTGALDESVMDYKTEVPLFSSGAEAAEHGMAEIDNPGEKARKTIEKLIRSNGL